MECIFVVLLFLCFFSSFPNHTLQSAGWRTSAKTQGSSSSTVDPTRVIQISRHPRAFIYKGFLTDKECDHLIYLAKDKLHKSMVVDLDSGMSVPSKARTSSGMFLEKAQDEVVADIEARIAAWTFLPVENGESIHILRYEIGEKYDPHYDTFFDEYNIGRGGNRAATVLIYLSNVNKGGETVFPNFDEDTQSKGDDWSECAKQGYAVKPRKGDALLFFSLQPNTTIDYYSLHGSCPVIDGEKWSATKWIHVGNYDCVDQSPKCRLWATAGECEKNPLYMVGSKDKKGYCNWSCRACDP